jgi:hypothetical protein
MKNIQKQYTDLLEGKMSKQNFMRNVRMQFPQHVTNVTSYEDSVKILKGKRILSEAPEGVYGHNPNAEAPKNPGIDQLNYYQVYHGIQYELAKMPEITDAAYVEARKKVVANIVKDPNAYKELQLANFRAVEKMDKDLRMKEVEENNKVDKPNEMKVVKKDAPANTQNTLGKKEKAKKSVKGVKEMTQTPKKVKGVDVMEVPKKENAVSLKEHILDELTKPNESHEYINVGSRVKKKGDDSKVGNVTEFDGDTATVKWDDGSLDHIQINVLTKKDLPKVGDTSAFDRLPDMGSYGQNWASNVKEDESEEDRKGKLQKLKEKLTKAVKEVIFRDKTTGKAQSIDPKDPIMRDPDFNRVFKKA